VPAQALLLPGVVLPAELAYGGLLAAFDRERVEAVIKGLELYRADAPPPDYSLETEVEGILRTADEAGFGRFHLVGYSGGGASALAFTAAHPERLHSLSLLEPAWMGNEGQSAEEQALRRRFADVSGLPPDELMQSFIALQLAPGVDPPPTPEGPPPPWMATRPSGIAALMAAFERHRLDREALRGFSGPVYYALGGLSNPDYFGSMAATAQELFADCTVEVFEERHHFDPPHRAEPERLARSLEAHFERAEQAQ
jgi:pimeloyl-ACP methyl ester carboxylesterase